MIYKSGTVLRFAIVGMGSIGKVYLAAILKNVEAKLVAFCDLKPPDSLEIKDSISEEVGYYESIDEMLEESYLSIDVVVLATPSAYHKEQAIKVLEKKIHILIEAPMVLKKEDGEEILYKSLNVSREVFVSRPHRFTSSCTWLKGIIEREYLGNITLVQVNVFLNRDLRHYGKNIWRGNKELNGGTLFSQIGPFIDALYWMFGDINNIKSNFKYYLHKGLTNFEDTGIIQFDWVNGGIGTISFTTAVWDKDIEGSITVLGEKGSVKLGGLMMEKVEYAHIKGYDIPVLNNTNYLDRHEFPIKNVIQNVIDSLKKRLPPSNHAIEAVKVTEMIQKIYNQ